MSGAEAGHHSPTTTPHAPTPADEKTLFGQAFDGRDEATLIDALEKAFDYRGDVTVTRADGSTITGYIFDRIKGRTLKDSAIRIMTAIDDTKHRVNFSEVARVEFSGKDAAHGKSFENWVKRYIEKKKKGEKASIESEAL